MRSAAASYRSVVSALTSESWLGSSSILMSAAAAPYLAWLSTTATQAEQAGTQANAAAAAYESAFAVTVPPAIVAANRAQLSNLVATNAFGQNTPAIAAAEAQYTEMWAQDAVTMNGYAGASDSASELTPVTAPQSTTNADGAADQAAAVAQSSGPLATVSSVFSNITAPGSDTATAGLAGVLNSLDGSNGALLGSFLSNATFPNFTNGFTTSGLLNPTSFIDSVTAYSFLSGVGEGGSAAEASDLAAGLGPAETLGSAGLPGLAAAEMGRANLVGALSVPPSWGATGATINPVVSTTNIGAGAYQSLGATPIVVEDVGPVGMPGMPLAGMAGMADYEFSAPVYGFRPHIMGRPPAAG